VKRETKTYTVGSKKQYDGLIEAVREMEAIGDPSLPPPTKSEAKAAFRDAEKTLAYARKNPDKVTRRIVKTPDWDLTLMIPDYAEKFFLPFLREAGLTINYKSEPDFVRQVEKQANVKGLPGNIVAGARNAARGLRELVDAEASVKSGRFEKAAVHMGRAGPCIGLMQVAIMELEWHRGQQKVSSLELGQANQNHQKYSPDDHRRAEGYLQQKLDEGHKIGRAMELTEGTLGIPVGTLKDWRKLKKVKVTKPSK